MLEDIKVAGRLHDDLKRKVTNLEQWSDDLAQSFNIVEDRVATLEQWRDELVESLGL